MRKSITRDHGRDREIADVGEEAGQQTFIAWLLDALSELAMSTSTMTMDDTRNGG